jgi:arylsulfatase A-like enzyme
MATYPGIELIKVRLQEKEAGLEAWIACVTISAVLALSFEIELLDHIDGFLRFMTASEIALDAGFVLIGVLSLGVMWWFGVLVVVGVLNSTRDLSQRRIGFFWGVWLSVPLTYLVMDILNAIKIGFLSEWHPGRLSLLAVAAVLILCGMVIVRRIRVASLQTFCRQRLVPVGLAHYAVCGVAGVVLLVHGVYFFRDYVHSGKITAIQRPDVYLITIDALRADDMSIYGYSLPTTPNLARFAEKSTTFDYFVANSNFTTSSTVSIETGTLPWLHRVFQLWGFVRNGKDRTVEEMMHQQGYYTAMISSNVLASPIQHGTLAGYDAVEYPAPLGFYGGWRYTRFVGTNLQSTISVSALGHLAELGSYLDMLLWGDRYPFPAEAVFDRARSLVENESGKQPLFVWTHILPPHDPYWPPESLRRSFLPTESPKSYINPSSSDTHKLPTGASAIDQRLRYDEMVLYADREVGRFLDWLESSGRLSRSVVIVTADHGESFEHNWFSHTGPHLYNGLIHIPLLIHLPGQEKAARVEDLAEQTDLLPTIVDLTGGGIPKTSGISLRTALEGNSLPERYVFSMNLEPNSTFLPITKGTVAVMDGEYKYVNYLDTQKQFLYRYRSDENENQNLLDTKPEVAERMREVMLKSLNEVNREFNASRH